MNPWNWFVLTGGIALAIRELVPAWRNLAKRDREWWSGLVWGLLALAIAIVVGVQGCQDATAQAGLLTTQQMEKIFATLGTAPANSPDALSILCLGNWQRTKSNALVGNLNFVLTALGWDVVFPGPNGWGDAP